MKKLILFVLMSLSLNLLANQEHEAGMEADPGQSRLAETRACFEQLDVAGCGNPTMDRSHFSECAIDRKSDLPMNCQKLVSKLYQ